METKNTTNNGGKIETCHAAYIDWEDFLQNMRFQEGSRTGTLLARA